MEVLILGKFEISIKFIQTSSDLEQVFEDGLDGLLAIILDHTSTLSTELKKRILEINVPIINLLEESVDLTRENLPPRVQVKWDKVSTELFSALNDIIEHSGVRAYLTETVNESGQRLIPISASKLNENELPEFDYFIRLSDDKFIKVVAKDQPYDKDLIERYTQKTTKPLYMLEESFKDLSHKLMAKLSNSLKVSGLAKSKVIDLQFMMVKEVGHYVRQLGLSKDVVNLTEDVLDSLKRDLVKSSPNSLRKYLEYILKGETYLSKKILLTNYILTAVCGKLDWASPESLRKLIFSSLFCDCSFHPDDEELSSVLKVEESKGPEDYYLIKKVKIHPKASKDLIQQVDLFLTDEISIILHHHELPDGKGFPSGLNYKNTPVITCLFILVYNFTHNLIETIDESGEMNTKKAIENLHPAFSSGNYQNCYKVLLQVIKFKSE